MFTLPKGVSVEVRPCPSTELAFLADHTPPLLHSYSLDIRFEDFVTKEQSDFFMNSLSDKPLSVEIDYAPENFATVAAAKAAPLLQEKQEAMQATADIMLGRESHQLLKQILEHVSGMLETGKSITKREDLAYELFGDKHYLDPSYMTNSQRNNWWDKIINDVVESKVTEAFAAVSVKKPLFLNRFTSLFAKRGSRSTLTAAMLSGRHCKDYVLCALSEELVLNAQKVDDEFERAGTTDRVDQSILSTAQVFLDEHNEEMKLAAKEAKAAQEATFRARAEELAEHDLRLKLSLEQGFDGRAAYVSARGNQICHSLETNIQQRASEMIPDVPLVVNVEFGFDSPEDPQDLAFGAEYFSNESQPSLEALVINKIVTELIGSAESRKALHIGHNEPVTTYICRQTDYEYMAYHAHEDPRAPEAVMVSSLLDLYPKNAVDQFKISWTLGGAEDE